MLKEKFKILDYQNYLEVIKASEGSKMFRNFYVLNDNKKRDILENGQLSCARYVTSILKLSDLISETHATVSGTMRDMLENDWKPTKKLVPGNILVWGKAVSSNGKPHSHIGFYLGADKAMSHREEKCLPIIHHYTYGKDKNGNHKRKIVKILTHQLIK
ncbi:MAG: hypothetical protein U9P63_02320 [Patescibacteria group bacterium]|nr:hypothetical protein [Patescibacteria group bacterium]MEA2113468.1 hypothetical protein [Patescibacteria group bacterium]